jgi:hypothetical protein
MLLAVLAVCIPALGETSPSGAPAPAEKALPRTHSHNDYEHAHPLFDALHHGFVSVEADVYLVGADLRISHDKVQDWSKAPTLEAAYLTPLRDLKARRKGGVYADGTPVMLLVDIKTEAVATYRRVHDVLANYQASSPGLFTKYSKAANGSYQVRPGAVTVVISGNRPRDAMAAQEVRYAGFDGRLADIGPDKRPEDSAGLIPMISDNWKVVFTGDARWDGTGEMPAATRMKLKELAETVHAEGKLLRFWNLPGNGPAVWGPLYDAGVDLINTDELAGLSSYVKGRIAKRAAE